MKKLIALFAIVVLATAISFAQSFNTSTGHNTFSSNVVCLIMVTPEQGAGAIGDFMPGVMTQPAITPNSLVFTVSGYSTKHFTLTTTVTAKVPTTGPALTLHYVWAYESAPGTFTDMHTDAQFTAADGIWPFFNTATQDGCTGEKKFQIRATNVDVEAGVPQGAYTFPVTATAVYSLPS
jgi:hypothetical protein